MNQEHYIELIAQHLTGEISEQERKVLMDWVNSDAKNQALWNETTQLWEVTNQYETTFDANIEAAWNKVDQKTTVTDTPNHSSAKVVRLNSFNRILQIAAVFLIATVAGWLWFSQEAEPQLMAYQTNDEETLEILLPDESQVVLNENSHLTFIEKDGKRMLTLEGEAWFDVKHLDDVPFEIESGDARTRVLGTAFNVRAYPQEDKIEVSVERGKVALSEKENIKNIQMLPAGTEGVFYKKEKTVVKEKRENDNANAWRTKKLIFEYTPMPKVFETLEKYYEVEIEGNPNIAHCPLKGEFDDDPIEMILEVIKASLSDAEVEKEGNRIKFIGGACPSNN